MARILIPILLITISWSGYWFWGTNDNLENIYTSLGAVAHGARIVEKHYVDDKTKRKGPDVSSSMDKEDLKRLIHGSREIFRARGGEKKPLKQEKSTMNFAFASVVAIKKIVKGEKLYISIPS